MACTRGWTGSPTSSRIKNDPFHTVFDLLLFFCLLFFSLSRFNTMAALDPGPSVPIRPHFQLLHLLRKSSIPRSFLVSSSLFFLPHSFVRTHGGSSLCCLCVSVRVCVYCVCVFRRVGVKASLCLLAGIGSNPGVPFTHLLWKKTVVWLLQPHPPSTKTRLPPRSASPIPHSQSCTASLLPHRYSSNGKHDFHKA